ncbi:transcriptional repressor [Peptoniphilus sp. MSJ-1]|uniref:Transcriptional repressor n=1 Tax=Peptoniphilus ovalis TaxID=2841503 RepID=A0ABS6FGP9_9FIRM|nr:Fur family transcriptional regulator [Peptoniphilus ovalis]MBU5669353.1 transcriptional repressor [Peptoniphilus ovalis]
MKDFEKLLRDNNLKITKGRLAILELLHQSKIPMNTEEIFAEVDKEELPSFTSLYRILNQLTDVGIIEKNLYQNGLLYYELRDKKHKHYIICEKCGKISAIENCPISDFEKEASIETGYIVVDHVIELKGICPDCQNK